jgi:hypothetical protein
MQNICIINLRNVGLRCNDLICCGLDLNQHTLSGTSLSKWQKPLFVPARACSRTHLFAVTIAGV